MNGSDILSFFDDFFPFFIGFLNRFHSNFNDFITSEIGKEWTIGENIIEANLICFKLTKMNFDDSPVNFFPQIFKFTLINEPLLVILLKFLFLVVE